MISPAISIALAFILVGGPAGSADDLASRPRLATDGRAVEYRLPAAAGVDRAGADQVALDRSFRVRLLGAEVDVVGRVAITEGTLRYAPRFPFRPGTRLVATFDPKPLGLVGEPVESTLRIPDEPPGLVTRLDLIAPSGATVPENLLRFYLHFTAPMAKGLAYDSIRLVDETTGREVDHAFLELGEELWNPAGDRFTLLLDPGRIKRGLVPHEEMGPILVEGREYSLVVSADWKDARGRPLGRELRHPFRATAEVAAAIDPGRWTIIAPAASTRDPLRIQFDRPLDRALVERLIRVHDAAGHALENGLHVVALGEEELRYTPAAPWSSGEYRVIVGSELEDAAGNNVRGPFEVDLIDPIEPRVPANSVGRSFRVR